MTTGNDPYVEHLRGQLTAVLDEVSPPAAPTAAVKRRGKAIRTRRRVGVTAGLAVAIIAAALVPGLLRQAKAPAPTPTNYKHPKVTVRTIGRDAPRGLIAQGSINGKPWRIKANWQSGQLCFRASGNLPEMGCGSPGDEATYPAVLDGAGGGSIEALYGGVVSQVRRVTIELSDGVVLNLHPVRFAGDRWIALELPTKLAVTRVVAYSRSGELAYAIPFTAAGGGLPSVELWLRPGQPVPREFTRLIGSGVVAGKRWSVTVHAGPWGQCVVVDLPAPGGGACWPPSRQPGPIAGSADWILGAARPKVSYLELTMTDGSTQRVPTVQVGSLRLYAIVFTHRSQIARWAAYDASGHRLYGGHGAPSIG